ncbi:uncharacterized protein LOC143769937 [Ranitomeya variabilis]|uniref:uncharacterized protein LOC143769937 n=1 Tax=Ranitomeya variabilis TaxID=490064 RepID=UPI004057564D
MKMFLLFSILVVAGSLVQGFPMKKETKQKILCIPGENDIACAQENDILDQAQQSNVIDRGIMSKKVDSYIASVSSYEEDAGSGNDVSSGEEPGSASESYADYNEITDTQKHFYEDNLII